MEEGQTLQRRENEIVEDKSAEITSDEEVIKIRKDKIIKFFKTNYNWISYAVLAIITYLAVKIRTSNLGGLKDITTGTWTLGPDLDPFFFLRLAEYIVEHGKLMVTDTMRYVPVGFDMAGEYLLHPYLIAWFHKFAAVFGFTESVTHSAVLYPAFMFGLTVIAFFFMTRKIFLESMGEKNANIIALVGSFFLSVIPSLLPRTIAGIPEKESAAFLFLFLAFYFFISAWKTEHKQGRYLLAVLAGLSTAAMANIWGGYIFIFLTIAPCILFAFIFGKVDKVRFYTYSLWLFSSFIVMALTRYSVKSLVSSISTGPSFVVFFVIFIHFLIFGTSLKNHFKSGKISKVPPRVLSIIITVILLVVLASVIFGPLFIPSKISAIKDNLVKPATSRLIQTVAENRQPYFNEWANSFGPHLRGVPVTFWLFFFGSIYLFNKMIFVFKEKERKILNFAYVVLLVSVIFSRYSPNSSLNGENYLSLFVYAIGFIIFIGVVGFYYYKYYKNGEEEKLKQIDLGLILIFTFFFLSIISARAAVRTIMMLVPPVSIIVAYFAVASFNDAKKVKNGTLKIIAWALVGLIIILTLFSGYGFYTSVKAQAPDHIPSIYTQQWQKAMFWVRENTPENAIFGHWWDYGYWLQSIGERATVLDGGNAIPYWNHMMGRYALTGPNETEALEFLYAHKTTHFLIDSTDIGKYSAFSSIGSDVNYDRASYIPTFVRDLGQTQEKKNSTVFVYAGGVGLDEDIIYEENGTRVFLPAGKAGLGAILVEKDSPTGEVLEQPRGIFVYQGQQYNLPFRYTFSGEFKDFGTGVEAGIYLMPTVIPSGSGIQIEQDGALLYLSKRTVNSQLARLYLYKEEGAFKLVHSEDDFFVSQIKSQNPGFNSDIMYYQGVRGPIRIWEINYPDSIKLKEEYLNNHYPDEISIAR
ncbi:MAG: hypothetical protein KJ718_01500 [Nanoarchaeota archaeon]|nr:hypothetical protein [Nanoarchaeota archaeon]MBU1051209.1 hypothetical protein [Nanoarchaeota archaeon]